MALDAVEDARVDGARDADPGAHGRRQRAARRAGVGNSSRARATWCATRSRSAGVAVARAQVVLGQARAGRCGRSPSRLATSRMKFVSWKATPRRASSRVGAGRRAEQRRHDQPDGRGAALHVALELGLARDPHGSSQSTRIDAM